MLQKVFLFLDFISLLQISKGSKAELECSNFILPNRRGKRCPHVFTDSSNGNTGSFCGEELQGRDNKRT